MQIGSSCCLAVLPSIRLLKVDMKPLTGACRRPGRLKALEPVGHLLQDGLQLQHVAGLRKAAGRNDLHVRQTVLLDAGSTTPALTAASRARVHAFVRACQIAW